MLVALSVPGLVGRNPFAASPLPVLGPAYFVGLLVSVIGAFLLQAALIRATIDDLGGRKVDFAECLMTALRNFLPILGIAIVSSFAIGIGFVFLIVPGIIIGLMWSVSVPSQIEEKRGVFGSLSRSRELTKGSRWALLGLVVVIYIVAAVIAALVGVLAVALRPDDRRLRQRAGRLDQQWHLLDGHSCGLCRVADRQGRRFDCGPCRHIRLTKSL